jgi:hypothetical protein
MAHGVKDPTELLIMQNLEQLAFLVGNGDSSVYKKIIESKSYGAFMVQKIECANYLLKNYVSKLKDIAQKRFSSKGNQIGLIIKGRIYMHLHIFLLNSFGLL